MDRDWRLLRVWNGTVTPAVPLRGRDFAGRMGMYAFPRTWILAAVFCCSCQETKTVSDLPADVPAGSTAATTTTTPVPQTRPSPACAPAAGRLCPADEGPSDASFAAFRQKMLDAVKAKDES